MSRMPGQKDDDEDNLCGRNTVIPQPKPDATFWWYDQQITRLWEYIHTPQVFMFGVNVPMIESLINRIGAEPDYMTEKQRQRFDALRKEYYG